MPLQVISNDTCSFTPANDVHDGTRVDPSLGLVLISAHAGGGGGGGGGGGACQETPLGSVLCVAPLLSRVAHTFQS